MSLPKVTAVFLAAGKSRRMGKNKLNLPLGRSTIGSVSLWAAFESNLEHILVVTRQDDSLEWMDRSFFQQPFRANWSQVRCNDAEKGQGHSLKCGVQAALNRQPNAIMVLLADQPFLSAKIISELISYGERFADQRGTHDLAYIAASFQNIPRPPVLFFHRFCQKLLKLSGDEGARRLLKNASTLKGLLVEMTDEKVLFDIDTIEDYRAAINKGWH